MVYSTVTPRPPRPQTFLCEHDNFKHPERIGSIFYMYIDIGERRIAGKQDGPVPIFMYGPPIGPRIAKHAIRFILWPIYEKLMVICSPCYA